MRRGSSIPRLPNQKTLTTLTEFLRELTPGDDCWNRQRPYPDRPEWWLISHGFRAPRVRSNSEDWRAALPGLVELKLARPADRSDGRTRLGQLQQVLDDWPESWWGKQGRIAQDVAGRLGDFPELRRDIKKQIGKLPVLSATSADVNAPLRAAFGDGDGRPLTEELLGLWLGDFDLLVIDEAHKSRSDLDAEDDAMGAVNGTVLARLVDRLLKQPRWGRRLCLTATPMELGLDQWLDLLRRARCDVDLGQAGAVIKRFRDAAMQARMAPDEGPRTRRTVRRRPRIHAHPRGFRDQAPARRRRARCRLPHRGEQTARSASIPTHREDSDRMDANDGEEFSLDRRLVRRGRHEPQRPRIVAGRHQELAQSDPRCLYEAAQRACQHRSDRSRRQSADPGSRQRRRGARKVQDLPCVVLVPQIARRSPPGAERNGAGSWCRFRS